MQIHDKWKKVKEAWPILLILFAGAVLRFKGLNYQSLWLDELHTMKQSDPNITWGNLFGHLKCCDQHPPLHFMLSRVVFQVFGHTPMIARMIPAFIGVFAILAMYWLGRELKDKTVGLLAAALTCVNFYAIYYSQEARMYSLSFLLATLSFLFFIRLIKHPQTKTAIVYALVTLCFLYTHYYSLFALAAQAAIGMVIMLSEKPQAKKILFRSFLLSTVIIIIGYTPWIPYLITAINIKSFWITGIDHRFLQNYFHEYFGNSEILTPVLVALLVLFIAGVALKDRMGERLPLKQDKTAFTFFVLLAWVFITLLIPYIRSITAFPMLFPRYAIVVLPAFIIAVACGIAMFRQKLVIGAIMFFIAVISLVNLVVTRSHYSAISKTQFRELTRFIVDNNTANYPIINEVTMWHQAYYLDLYGSKASRLNGKKEAIIDSILRKSSPQYDVNGFWVVGAHNDKKPQDSIFKAIDTAYVLTEGVNLVDAWAYLFISKKEKEYASVGFQDFTGGSPIPEQKVVAIYNGSIQSAPVVLPKGNYMVGITAYGDPGNGIYPHLNIYVNDHKIGDYNLIGNISQKKFRLENPAEGNVIVKIEMDNDFFEPGKGDRNAFVSRVVFEVAK